MSARHPAQACPMCVKYPHGFETQSKTLKSVNINFCHISHQAPAPFGAKKVDRDMWRRVLSKSGLSEDSQTTKSCPTILSNLNFFNS